MFDAFGASKYTVNPDALGYQQTVATVKQTNEETIKADKCSLILCESQQTNC